MGREGRTKKEEEDGEEAGRGEKEILTRKRENSTCLRDCPEVIPPVCAVEAVLFFAQLLLVMQMEGQPLVLMTSLFYLTFL